MKRNMRPMGTILLDLEKILDEMVDSHKVQLGDVLALVKSHIEIHRQDAIELYTDNTNPVFYYGHKDYK